MDNNEVYLTISINYNGQSHTEKSKDFISFEDIKNKSKIEFNIPEEDYKYMKLRLKNDTNNETIFIENDSDIIFKSTEKDEYNYEMTIDLTIDKNNSIQVEEKKIELMKDGQNEESNKNSIISENTKIENEEKKVDINNEKEMSDAKNDSINMSYNNNDKNKILNKTENNNNNIKKNQRKKNVIIDNNEIENNNLYKTEINTKVNSPKNNKTNKCCTRLSQTSKKNTKKNNNKENTKDNNENNTNIQNYNTVNFLELNKYNIPNQFDTINKSNKSSFNSLYTYFDIFRLRQQAANFKDKLNTLNKLISK